MRSLVTSAAILLAAFAFGPACDSDGGDSGPLTACEFPYTVQNPNGKDIGERCTSGDECEYGTCLMPGADGNEINTDFGFCTRGCECGDTADSQLSDDEKQSYLCLYPSGFRDRHFVALTCGQTSDCTAIDPDYTSCGSPPTGGVRSVCQAR